MPSTKLQQKTHPGRLGPELSMHITSQTVTPIDSEILPQVSLQQVQQASDSSAEASFRSHAASHQREPYARCASEWGLSVHSLQSPTPRSDATLPSSNATPEPSARQEAALTKAAAMQHKHSPTVPRQTSSIVQIAQSPSSSAAPLLSNRSEVQPVSNSEQEPASSQEAAALQPDLYAKRVTEEGMTVQTLVPPGPDPGQAVAGRVRRARAALAARTRQMHGPLPMLPRRVPPRPVTAGPPQVTESWLLQLAQEHSPDEVGAVKLPGRGISSIQAEHLASFCNLRHLDLSGNRLSSLHPMSTLPALHTLLLSGNHIASLADCANGSFCCLETLDVSFNSLQPACLLQLGQWPQLRHLDISGNQLSSWAAPAGSFCKLQMLKAAQCRLQDDCLQQLGALPNLSELYLASNHIAKVPNLAATAARTKLFRDLQLLDLGSNRVTAVSSIQPLLALPSLKLVKLLSNPVANSSAAFTKAFSRAKVSGGSILLDRQAPAAVQSPALDPVLVLQLHDDPTPTPLIAQFLPSELPLIEDLPLQGIDLTPGALAFEYSHDKITEAFNKLQEDFQHWSAALADSAEADSPRAAPQMQQQGGMEPAAETAGDNGRSETAASEQGSVVGTDACDTEVDSRITDPTVRLAVALGLDPGHLTIYSGRPGTDCASAVAALHFALNHPLTEADEGSHALPHFHQMTRSVAAKHRSKVQPRQMQQPDASRSFKMDKIDTIEGILAGMKTRLQGLEKSLVAQLDHKKQQGLLADDKLNLSENKLPVDVSGHVSLVMPRAQ